MARRKGNDVDGILLLDKPLGRSSNNALQKVRYLFQAKKAGHTGSLDPLATGVLPICFGQASKVTPYLLDADKSYRCTAQLGITTTTGDKEGEVLQEREVTSFSEDDVEAVLETFRGPIQQIPPMYSALKHNGQPLYKLARQGIDIKRKPRDVTIHELVLIEKTEDTITLDVRCSKGTYIRTLAQDIGEALGFGAHLSMLRRTHVSPFNCDKLYTIEDIEKLAEEGKLEEALLPIDTALQELPSLNLSEEETKLLRNGIKVKKAGTPDSDMIRLYNQNDTFIGIGRQSKNENDEIQIAPRRMMNTHEPLAE
ncbi:tRNA pseudouridine(55) synthase TruB [uncultured Cocleimonas sp.]|uniref:tRNA pseudouridine(55) synthase TruB n=1 Tax=uncultured Cocleimonas sp. TaxID=1051587 RepID=UPI00261C32A9|nr:tRNA pseudouridine(55) synthase TruB [uncultured Cocleimonas sp.]